MSRRIPQGQATPRRAIDPLVRGAMWVLVGYMTLQKSRIVERFVVD